MKAAFCISGDVSFDTLKAQGNIHNSPKATQNSSLVSNTVSEFLLYSLKISSKVTDLDVLKDTGSFFHQNQCPSNSRSDISCQRNVFTLFCPGRN